MKRLLIFPLITVLLSVSSCKKSDSSDNNDSSDKFTLGTQTFLVDHVTTDSTTEISITAFDKNGNAIGAQFEDNLPTASGTFHVVNNPTQPDQVKIFAATNYAAHRWESVESFGAQTVAVTVSAGKVRINIKDISLYSSTGDTPIEATADLKQ